jgi:leader peptidase (prepilin peptidase)/N-methyltransferase
MGSKVITALYHQRAPLRETQHIPKKGGGRVQGYGTEFLARMAEAGAAEWSLVMASPFIGSFLGLLIQRLPNGARITRGRSCCDACGTPLRARDLIPLLSWLVAGRRCRYCRQPLGWFYPGVELAALAVALAAVLIDGGQRAWLDCLLGWWLLALGWIDLRCWLLPDALTLPLIIAGLVAGFLFNPDQLTDRALGAALGYLTLMAIAALYRAFRGREGLGGGDAKLLAASGAWLGAAVLPEVILFAALSALAAAACLRLAGLRLGIHSALPFGPFLALATWILWLWAPLD